MQNLSFNRFVTGQDVASSTPTQSEYVNYVQLTNQKGNQKPRWNREMGKNNKKGGNKKENTNYDKNEENANGDKKTKQKIILLCKLCGGYHLIHLFPRIYEAS